MHIMASALRGTLLHNPRCSKSRGALAMLRAANAHFDVRDLTVKPLDLPELVDLGHRLRESPLDWCRRGEAGWEDRFSANDESAYHALSERPELIQRPIFLRGPWGVVARPPDLVLAFLAPTCQPMPRRLAGRRSTASTRMADRTGWRSHQALKERSCSQTTTRPKVIIRATLCGASTWLAPCRSAVR